MKPVTKQNDLRFLYRVFSKCEMSAADSCGFLKKKEKNEKLVMVASPFQSSK